MNQPATDPGVRFPPPLMFLLALAIGWALHRWWLPWPLVDPGHAWWLYPLAAAFALLALWLLGSALGLFRRRGNDPRPWREDSTLVVDGIYRQTRNPMYVGMTLLGVAGALALNTAWPLPWLAAAVVIVRRYVIAREEAYLMRRFGRDYSDYQARVRRWF